MDALTAATLAIEDYRTEMRLDYREALTEDQISEVCARLDAESRQVVGIMRLQHALMEA